ncbi:transposase [Bordetella tumulicola]|uniref:transposase n=1 Tax=Bordetella tumulicola TaxID=1649133 RepID=UPI0039EE824A
MTRVELEIKLTRRSYSKQFKREVVAECQQGQSVSSVALKHNMIANIACINGFVWRSPDN